ncbi:MAG TPA: LamG-like jellyroll fold domain-containing protein [Polyangiaceae bacterium]|nr:LamG-like jellyroll fold domain-containing protein [Polyangiaceae bacterium]
MPRRRPQAARRRWIGRSQFIADEEFQGSIDEVRIYGVARSAQQIAAEIAAGPDQLPDG